MRPPKDEIQNFNLMAFEEREGYTSLTFHRNRNTRDYKDLEITVKCWFYLFILKEDLS